MPAVRGRYTQPSSARCGKALRRAVNVPVYCPRRERRQGPPEQKRRVIYLTNVIPTRCRWRVVSSHPPTSLRATAIGCFINNTMATDPSHGERSRTMTLYTLTLEGLFFYISMFAQVIPRLPSGRHGHSQAVESILPGPSGRALITPCATWWEGWSDSGPNGYPVYCPPVVVERRIMLFPSLSPPTIQP